MTAPAIDFGRAYKLTQAARLLQLPLARFQIFRRCVAGRVTPKYRHSIPPCFFVGRGVACFPGEALGMFLEGNVQEFNLRAWLERLFEPDRMYTPYEVAEVLGVSARALRSWSLYAEHASSLNEVDGCCPGPQSVFASDVQLYPGAAVIAYCLRNEYHVCTVRCRTRLLAHQVERWGYARQDLGDGLSMATFASQGGWTCGAQELVALLKDPKIFAYAQTQSGWMRVNVTIGAP